MADFAMPIDSRSVAPTKYNDQDALAYFTRPTRSINHRAISEIRSETKQKAVKPATADQLNEFLSCWPDVDGETGLILRGDELLVKSREAMIAAVHNFNSAGTRGSHHFGILTEAYHRTRTVAFGLAYGGC